MGALAAISRGAACLAGTALLMPGVILVLRGRVLDVPNERSSHTAVTPRGGGTGPAVAISVVTAAWWAGPRGHLLAGILVAAVAMGVLGLVDDLLRQGPLVRLTGQVVIATVAALLLTGAMHQSTALRLVALVVAAGWLVAFVNAFNFMDGINGISAVTAAGTGITWLILGVWQHAPALAVVGAVAAGGALGFLPFNFPRAQVFLGDVGSYFFGGLLGAGLVVGLRSGLHPEAVTAPLVPYVLDTGVTLIRRLLSGENVLAAHRDHAYQRMCAAGWSHPQTTGLVAGLMVVLGGLGLAAEAGAAVRIPADVLIAAVGVGYLLVPYWLGRSSRVGTVNR